MQCLPPINLAYQLYSKSTVFECRFDSYDVDLRRYNFEYTVVITPEDASLEQFRSDVERSLITSYDFIERCRVPNPARPERETRFFDRMSNEEIFVWKFKQEITNHINRYSTENRGYPRTLVPAERLQAFIAKEYPFIPL